MARSDLKLLLLLIGSFYFIRTTVSAEEGSLLAPVILEQEPAPGNAAGSAAPLIRIKFQDDGDQLKKEGLLMEVDRSDVSAFAQFADHTLSYQPPAPLLPGSHEVRISGTAADGRKMQEVLWNFTIPQNQTPRSWQFGLEPSATFEYKIRKDSSLPDRHRFNSNIAITSNNTGPIQSTFNSNLQAQDPNPSPTPKDFDLANFQANFTASSTSVSLWDVVVNYDPLSVANLARRGIFFQQKLPFLSSGFDVFSVRSEAIIGFQHGFGVSDSEQRIDGGSFFFAPTRKPENLTLRLYYLKGENALDQGFNFGGVTRGSKGNAYGLGLNTSTWANQLRVEGFAAWSDFDFNASDEFSGNKDHALLARIFIDPAPHTWKNRPSKFLAQLELQDLGLFFKSLGNPFLVSDRLGFNLNSSWTWGILGWTGGVSKFHDNVKNLNLLPTVDNLAYSAGFSVNPVGATGPPRWPSFSLTATRSEQESTGAKVSFLALHNIIDTVAGLVQLNRTKWSLNFNTNYSLNRDLNNRVPDSDTKGFTVAAIFMPAPLWNIGPSLSFTRQGNRDTKVDSDLWTYSLTSGIPIKPERITLDSQLSFSSTESSDQLNRNSNFSGTAQLSFHLHSFLKTPGRQTLALRVSYNRIIVDAPFVNRQKGLEIFGLMDLSWPFK